MNIKVKLVNNGIMPRCVRNGDVCYDCYARIDEDIILGEIPTKVPLGFALGLDFGWEGVIRPRSGLSNKGVDVKIGTIDSNYRGEVCACMTCMPGQDFVIHDGDRVCQLAIRQAPMHELILVDELDETVRGDSGFGSTGLRG